MNKHLHRIVFNAARGMRMVVQETAKSAGKATGATAAVAVTALASMLAPIAASAQIAAAQNVPNTLRPTVLVAPNGVPLVNIRTPSAAGVSRNVYNQFNVGPNGAILNNSRTNVQTQLGGWVQGNPYLATGPARIILNEINSGNPSQLRGYIEVGGSRAEVIIANPAGISVDGGGFINASRATLTTGTPQLNAMGGLDSFLVQGGTISIDGAGLDASTTDYAAILARAVNVNAAIYATDLKVIAGANQINADQSQITPTAGTGATPTFALDVSALGGMYAGKITLIGTESGLGVRNAGKLGASAGSLVVTAAGRLENIGTLEGQSVQLSSAADIDNRGGTIRQTSEAPLAITAPTLSNTNGGWIGTEPAPAPAPVTDQGTGGTGSTGGSGTTTGTGGTPTTGGTAGTPAPAPASAPVAPGSITAAGTLHNDGGKIYAGGPITLQSANIVNNGGTLSVASMAVNQPSFSNQGGTLNVSGVMSANVGTFDNSGGILNAGNLAITTSRDLLNVDGQLRSDSDATLTVGGKVDNTRGTISATGALNAKVTGAVNNTAGTLIANQGLALQAGSLDNSQGAIQSSLGATQLAVAGQVTNTGGTIGAATDLTVQAGTLSNTGTGTLRAANRATVNVDGTLTNDGGITAGQNLTVTAASLQGSKGVLGAGVQNDGSLGTAGDLKVNTTQGLTATGTNLAAGSMALQGASVDLTGSQTSAANIAITATQGDVTTSSATVVTPGTLSVTANAQAGQTLVNDAGKLNAGQLDLHASNITNTNAGEIVQTGAAATTIAVIGTLNNAGGLIAANSTDLTLQAGTIANTGGKIQHAGAGTLGIEANSFDGANGEITGNGALTVNVAGNFNQDGGTTSAKHITLDAGALSNRGGQIVQTEAEATRITVVGALDNSGGTIASNGATSIAAGSAVNQGGTIRAAGTSDLALAVAGALDNSNKGDIGAGANTTVNAGSLNNNAGNITAVGDLNATIAGVATNQAGTIAANGNTVLNAASLDNSTGTVAAVKGNLAVTTSGQTVNNGGTLQAGGQTLLSNGGLQSVGGKVYGDSLTIDTHGNQLNNAQGTLAATNGVAISSGTLANDAGLIQSGTAMVINTNGQGLSNTNAAGYANGQGGIVSADTLSLTTGAVNNTAGFIGAKNALTASTQGFSNNGGGLVVGQASVSVNTNGATYDNSGGQTQAVNDLTVNAGGINNTSGLFRSGGTTTLNAGTVVNANTLGTDQGVEGQNVAITAGNLDNTSGAIRADVNTTITSGGSVNNTSGWMSAGNTLRIGDPNAANPGAKTLLVTNTNGTLIAGVAPVYGADGALQTAGVGGVQIDAKGFSGDGALVGLNDLSISLTQDVVNNAVVEAGGNLSYITTGKLTNNGKLLAGGTATASGSNVDNTANAEINGNITVVNAANTLDNRGLIDGHDTRINGGTVNNIGTGRIYGDAVSIGAGTLNNDAETVNGVAAAGTIAARDTLDIGANTINNREHALIFSAGDMFIGGGLDANRYATGKGAVLNNLSASIESLGDMSVAMGSINNVDTHLKVATTSSTKLVPTIITMDGKSWEPFDAQGNPITWGDPSTRAVYHKAADGTVSVIGKGWTNSITNITVVEDSVESGTADPSRIVSGGNMRLDGHLYNRDSQVMAGGELDAPDVDNQATPGKRDTTTSAVWVGFNPNRPGKDPEQPIYIAPSTTTDTYKLTDYRPQSHLNGTKGYNAGAAGNTQVSGGAGGSGNVRTDTHAGPIIEVAANVGGSIKNSSTGAGAASSTDGANNAGGSQALPMVVRTSTPDIGIPQASLFRLQGAGSHYLIETDPRFANYRQWLSSDFLLSNLGLDPNNILKRLGDGFYEQKLIREQVAQLTGYRYLDGYYSDEAQYTALMNAGSAFAKEYGLRPGIALTAAQMAQLTSDIVWLVEQTVTLPDGSVQSVLVPQVYVRVQPGDIDGRGALLSADRVKIKGDGDVTNTGTIAGRSVVSINVDNINNLGGRISGGSVALDAKTDINNIGGTIDARDSLKLDAGRDINVRTTSQTNGANTNIDRVAGLYVTNPGGTLVASAGRDLNLIGAIVANQGAGGLTSLSAKNDINLGTVTETRSIVGVGATSSLAMTSTSELGSTIATNGTTILNAGRDVNARQATVDAGKGLLSVHADRDINIVSGSKDVQGSYSANWTDKSLLKKTANSFSADNAASTSVGSSFSGGMVLLDADRDILIEGSKISGTQGVAIIAGRDLSVVEGRNTASASVTSSSKTSGLGLLGGSIPMVGPIKKGSTTGMEIQTDSASASTIQSSQGGVLLQGGNSVFLQGVQVDAAKDINIRGGNVVIQAATNASSITGSHSSNNLNLGTETWWRDPSTGINAKKTTTTEAQQSTLARTTLTGANVSITAADTLAMAGTTVNTPGTLSLNADTLILGTQTTEQRTQTTSAGRDVVYQKTKDRGQSDQTTNYNQFNTGTLAVNANRIEAGLGARDSLEALAKQPGMAWVDQLNNDPKFAGKIDWKRVEEAHKQWDEGQQGLTPEGGALVTLVVVYFTAGAGSTLGGSVVSSVGATGTTATVISGAVAAGVTALSSQAAVALINNQGDIAGALRDLGSSASVKNLLTAIVTGGVLGGLNLNPTGLPTASGGAQEFFTQLGQNLKIGAVRALVSTAINGGSLEDNLKDGLTTAILDTAAAQGAFAIGEVNLDGFTNKAAHALAGCAVGAARSGGNCAAGAIGAVIGELSAEILGFDEYGNPLPEAIQMASMLGGIGAALAGEDAAGINLAAGAAANAAANNGLKHYVKNALGKLKSGLEKLELEPLVEKQALIKEYLEQAGGRGGLSEGEIITLGIMYAANEVLFPTSVIDVLGPASKAIGKVGKLIKAGEKAEDAAKTVAKEARIVEYTPNAGAVSNMSTYLKAPGFGSEIAEAANKTNYTYKGSAVYKATDGIGRNIKRGDNLYLDSRHKDHIEVFKSNGELRSVINLDGTLNDAKTAVARAEGRTWKP